MNPLLLAALALIALGTAVNALNIGFMAGAGWHMAAEFAAGRTDIVPVFEGTHPIGLIAARFGNFIISLGALALGWAEWQDATRPRWIAWLAWGAGTFLFGWAFQFLGHYYEGRKPAFADDIFGLLVGPLFVTAEALFSMGWNKPLLREIERRVRATHLRDLAHPA